MLIALWVQDEFRIDGFHSRGDTLHQVILNFENEDPVFTTEWTPGPLAEAAMAQIPEVDLAVTVLKAETDGLVFKEGNEDGLRAKVIFASSEFFDMFTFPIRYGNPQEALTDLNGIAISDGLAKRLYGSPEAALGQTLQWDQGSLTGSYLINSVFTEAPSYSTLQFDAVLTWDLLIAKNPDIDAWNYNDPSTYLALQPYASRESVSQKVTELIKSQPDTYVTSTLLMPFAGRYLHNRFENGKAAGGRITYVRLLIFIAILILVIATINFMNLATAQATRRMKEVGVKKAVGARKNSLIFQFLGESTILAFLSTLVAIGLAALLLDPFNTLVGKDMRIPFSGQHALQVLGIILATGLLAGSYPAMYISGFQPLMLLKSKLQIRGGETWVRQGLVVFQFTTSILLIVTVLVVSKQVDYIHSKNLGYSRDNVLTFQEEGEVGQHMDTFLEGVRNLPGVVAASNIYQGAMMDNLTLTKGITWEGQQPGDTVAFKYVNGNYDLVEVLDLNLVAGRSLSQDLPNEEDKVIFNEAAIKAMGLENPIGQIVNLWGKEREIVGVVEDFHIRSLYEPVTPFFTILSNNGSHIMVRITAGKEQETLENLKTFYAEFNYGLALDYRFLDDDYQNLYDSENKVAGLSKYFAVMAIIISCLGLFGLATFTLQRRTKEIGIRKVLGATEGQLVWLLSGSFSRWVVLALVLALPTGYFLARAWLNQFAYHIDLSASIFLIAGSLTLGLAWLTVSFQTFRSARLQPTDCLADE